VTSWYLSNNRSSHFVTGLMAARPDVERRYALRNSQFAVHHLNGDIERRALTSVAEFRSALAKAFQISLPETPDLDRALRRLVEQPSGR
jgi:N-hydroxyarylamine O-acetyltransferase